jgi:hypothetical protein
MFRPLILATLASSALASAALASPAAAQETPREKINMVIIYGDDKCPESKGDEITVCARKAESERYRIPAPLREGPKGPQSETWNSRVIAYERMSASGTQSCSAAGAGGWTGCAGQFIKDAYAEKKASTDVNFSKMIDAERQKRAAVVDATAAQQQAEVEQAEKAYIERRQKQAEEDEAKAKAAAK